MNLVVLSVHVIVCCTSHYHRTASTGRGDVRFELAITASEITSSVDASQGNVNSNSQANANNNDNNNNNNNNNNNQAPTNGQVTQPQSGPQCQGHSSCGASDLPVPT
jgi:hypothetical protein